MWVHALGRAAPVYRLQKIHVYELQQQHTTHLWFQSPRHHPHLVSDYGGSRGACTGQAAHEELRGGGGGTVKGNRQRDIRTNHTCLENGSVELVMMRRLRIELM